MVGPKGQAISVLIAAVVIGAVGGTAVERLRADPVPEQRDRGRRGPDREGRMPRPFEQLDLTEQQRTQVRAIFEAYEPRTRAVFEEMIPRMRALQDSARVEINEILTDEQRVQLEEMGNFWERRDRRGGRRGRGSGPPPDGPRPDSARQ